MAIAGRPAEQILVGINDLEGPFTNTQSSVQHAS